MFFELTSATLGVGPRFAYLNREAKKSFEFDKFENLQKKLRMWRFSTEGMKEALDGNFGWKLYDWYFFYEYGTQNTGKIFQRLGSVLEAF